MKKNLLLSLPYFHQNEKKILSNKHREKWTNSRTQNGVMPKTMYGMSRCVLSHTLFLLDYRKTWPKMEPWPKVDVLPCMFFNGPLMVNIDIVIVDANQGHKYISFSF